jgi:hypothetical protein
MVGQPVQHEGTIPELPHKLRVPNIVKPDVVRRNDQRLGDAERARSACGKEGAFGFGFVLSVRQRSTSRRCPTAVTRRVVQARWAIR